MNLYYEPEKFGLSIVAELETSSGSYEFDTIVVFKDAEGRKFWLRDAGCSCPTPFEDFGVSDLVPLNVDTLRLEDMREADPGETQEFFEKIR